MDNLTVVPMVVWLTLTVQLFCLLGSVVILIKSRHSIARMLAAFILVCAAFYLLLVGVIVESPSPFLLQLKGPFASDFFALKKWYDLISAAINLLIVWLCSPFGKYLLVCAYDENIK